MKKIFSVILTCVVALISLSGAASAERVGENGYLGVITNADGEIVRYVPMPAARTTYVDSGITLEPGESFTSYQYEPTSNFGMGMRFVGRYDSIPTTRDRTLLMAIYHSDSIGGEKYLVTGKRFSTNKEDHGSDNIIDGAVYVHCGISQVRPYYNAKFTNVSSSTGYFNIIVHMD